MFHCEKGKLFISFSGGETSAFMAGWLTKYGGYEQVVTLFANTGEELEKTLEFVNQCDEYFGLNVVWVEAVVDPIPGNGIRHKVVNFETAARQGEPFREVIKKYGIPNQSGAHCTKSVKLYPMNSYLKSIGWEPYSYDTAIGIRLDEIDRMSPKASQNHIIYPLINKALCPMTKPAINTYWRDMPFRLGIKGYEGNCKWCWKKTLRKHLTIAHEHPEYFNFPAEMERLYPLTGPCKTGEPKVFFRKNMSTMDILQLAKSKTFIAAEDDSVVYNDQRIELDAPSGGCSESCEVHHDD